MALRERAREKVEVLAGVLRAAERAAGLHATAVASAPADAAAGGMAAAAREMPPAVGDKGPSVSRRHAGRGGKKSSNRYRL